jgi:hypothetical protein
MKDSRYIVKGNTHRKGTTAISWVIRAVVAKRNNEAVAAKPIHSNRSLHESLIGQSLASISG